MSVRPSYSILSLNGGEVSYRTQARLDLDKYRASLNTCKNFLPIVTGGIQRRPGTVYVAKSKFSGSSNNVVRLVPFQFSRTQNYVLEFGYLYVRFFDDTGAQVESAPGVPYELATLYDDAMVPNLWFSQSADVLYIFSDGTIPVYKIRRVDPAPIFTISAVNWDAPGTTAAEYTGTELGAGVLTISATTGDDVVFTVATGIWLAGDVSMVIKSSTGGRAVITSVDSPTQVTVDILDPFLDLSPIQPDDWTLSGTPSAIANPTKQRKNATVEVTFDVASTRDAYLDSYILIYGGTISIDKIHSPTRISGRILAELVDRDKINPSPTGVWSLERDAWIEDAGYPTCGTFFQDRMFVCRDQTIWGSNSADYENFAKGADDGAGMERTISDDQVNPIIGVLGQDKLFLFTRGGPFVAHASSENGPITPNDFNVVAPTAEGSNRIKPVKAGGQIVYCQDGGRRLRELSFAFVDNKFRTPDLMRLSEHLTEFHWITAMDYQARPNRIIWCVRSDGIMLALTYERDEEVVGWSRFETAPTQAGECQIKSVAVIARPSTGYDWPWVAVDREINGVTETMIEYMESLVTEPCRDWPQANTDCCIFTTATDDVISGLDHLEGETVWVIGDGMLFNTLRTVVDGVETTTSTAVVSGGQITVDPPGLDISSFEVGLLYESEAITPEPVIPNDIGGPLMARGWEVCGARVRRTAGLKINGERIPFRTATDPMD